MDITYLGHSSFKIKTKTATVVTDPYDSKMVGLKYSSTDAEIVTITHSHQDHNSLEKVGNYKKVIDGPGEYEIAGVSIMGYPTYHDEKKGEERGKNTVYLIEAEGLKVVHLGDLGHMPSDDLIDELGDVDILIIPVGGTYTIGPKEAQQVVTKIEPSYVIPMHYLLDGHSEDFKGKLSPVEDYLKESGLTVERFPKFVVKREDISDEQLTKVIVLEKK